MKNIKYDAGVLVVMTAPVLHFWRATGGLAGYYFLFQLTDLASSRVQHAHTMSEVSEGNLEMSGGKSLYLLSKYNKKVFCIQ